MVFLGVPSASLAEQVPLWEVGFGFSGLQIPDYRGSNEGKGYILPFPYVDYRGNLLKIDRKGIYSRIFQAERLRVEMSADASVPVKSQNNSARQGMPDLDPIFEIGPSLEVCLSEECKGKRVWMFRVPVRAVIASDFTRVDSAGWVVNPHLNFDGYVAGPGGTWNFGVAVGPIFANERYHEYYYGVAPAYASATRPVYNARGGYSGFRVASAVSKRFENYWVGIFARYDNLSGAVFEDSPLFRTRHAFLAGFGVAWIFARSSTLVNAPPSL